MKKPTVRHAACGGLLTNVKTLDLTPCNEKVRFAKIEMVCGKCHRTITDPREISPEGRGPVFERDLSANRVGFMSTGVY